MSLFFVSYYEFWINLENSFSINMWNYKMFTWFFYCNNYIFFSHRVGPTNDLLFSPSTKNANCASHPAAPPWVDNAWCPVSSPSPVPIAAILKLPAATWSLLGPVSSGFGAHHNVTPVKHTGGPCEQIDVVCLTLNYCFFGKPGNPKGGKLGLERKHDLCSVFWNLPFLYIARLWSCG